MDAPLIGPDEVMALLCDSCRVGLSMAMALGAEDFTLCHDCVHRVAPDHVCHDEET